ncbi:periplasmic heavy metal sensor [Microvirga subterranea]|uniref:Heavy-metal resistance protein n=1 Tax=Microvirga subterranea TaxID=186651 RepID=A0A370HM08_9HYPH|nr:periplasmic heavy metal sensor [Microvirga subterranea]RDI57216.1 heavy-metal resistance protein [Microvirga subterranea]
MIRTDLLALFLAASSVPALAQHHHAPAGSPYAGFERRAVKALSDQQVADLKAGRGMGYALPAELNGYPGPSHVLELGEKLGLTEAQRRRMQNYFDAMKAETIPIGERLIAQEAELERQFSGRTVTAATLTVATAEIGATQAALRAAHLKYHVATVEILTTEQVRRYGELRGYFGVQ